MRIGSSVCKRERIVAGELGINSARELAMVILGDEGQDAQLTAESDVAPDDVRTALTCVGSYRVVRPLAAGGMAEVFEAEHPIRGRCALKVVRGVSTGSALVKRLLREAELLRLLDHPSIARVLDAGEGQVAGTSETAPYIAMELIDHARPIDAYADEEQLNLRRRVDLVKAVADAVHHGHQRGVIHRDLKPSNVLVSAEAVPKIIDFGIGAASHTLEAPVPTLQTMPGQLLGTLQYMSPEQLGGNPSAVDLRTDIYSLGMVLYQLTTGELPYSTAGAPLIVAAQVVRSAPIPPPRSKSRKIDRDLEAVIVKALARAPSQRYQSAGELRDDLARWLAGKRVAARASRRWISFTEALARHPIAATATACVLLVIASVGTSLAAVWYTNFRPHEFRLYRTEHKARLLSRGGATLAEWHKLGGTQGGLTPAVELHVERDGRVARLIALCFARDEDRRLPNIEIVSFDEPARVLWSGPGQTPVDLFPEYVERDINPYTGKIEPSPLFVGLTFLAADVFPQVPGEELIAILRNEPFFPAAVRIYGLGPLLDGGTEPEVLYESWHPGHIERMAWHEEAGLLIVAGGNNRLDYTQLDEPHEPRLSSNIVYAIRPVLDQINRDLWVTQYPAGTPGAPEWYQALRPSLVSERWGFGGLAIRGGDSFGGRDILVTLKPRGAVAKAAMGEDTGKAVDASIVFRLSTDNLEPILLPPNDDTRRQEVFQIPGRLDDDGNMIVWEFYEMELPAYQEVEPGT